MYTPASTRLRKQAHSTGTARNRSFGGCATCRSRHSKCDEGRPTCTNCQLAGLICGGYKKNIFFDFEDGAESSSGRFRRPLLTEEERKHMSETIVASVQPRTALRNIYEIDHLCETLSQVEDVQIIRGPFGVFGCLCDNNGKEPELRVEEAAAFSQDREDFGLGDEDQFPVDEFWAITPKTQRFLDLSLLSMGEPTASSTMNLAAFIEDSDRIREITDGTATSPNETYLPRINFMESTGCSIPYDVSESSPNPFDSLSNLSFISANDHDVPKDAVFLLKHYSTIVLPLLTVFRHAKTPWHILFLPHVKHCLAALTLGEDIDHASLTAFYGTLAVSASSLGGISQSPVWIQQATFYHRRAREHVKLTLKTAYNPRKTAKYKSILMALLTMVQISMISGNHDQKDCYLLEAERFIRVKGLNRKKSRKIRLLHHCYAFERIFHEALFVSSRNSIQRQHVRKAIESSGASRYSADTLSFRLGTWNDLEVDMLRVKGQVESENDLHLQIPGHWTRTMYPEIFGIPEPYLLLLSMIIRLKHEKDRSARGDSDAISLHNFTLRAKSLERCIKTVKSTVDMSKLQRDIPRHILDSMLEAMQHALSIYFYRRVYDLDASLLQSSVMTIRDCLRTFECANSDEANGSVRLVWPAFIGASEAQTSELQASFAQWFEFTAQRSGLQLFREALAKVELLRKDNDNSWEQVENNQYSAWFGPSFTAVTDG